MNEQSRIYDKTGSDASGHSGGRKTGSNEILQRLFDEAGEENEEKLQQN